MLLCMLKKEIHDVHSGEQVNIDTISQTNQYQVLIYTVIIKYPFLRVQNMQYYC